MFLRPKPFRGGYTNGNKDVFPINIFILFSSYVTINHSGFFFNQLDGERFMKKFIRFETVRNSNKIIEKVR